MKKWLSLLLVATVVVAAIPLMGCGEEAEKLPYKIGAVFAITGPNSPLGVPEKQTIEMMVEQINANGGINDRPIEVTIYDTETDATKCISMVDKLIQDDVLAIVGPSSTGTSMAIIDTMTSAKVPLVSCAAGITIVTPVTERYWIFKTPQSDFLAVQELYEYLQAQDYTKIAIICDTGGFGQGGQAILEAQAANYGLTIVATQNFGISDTDMTSQVTQIAGTDAQAVVCWGTNPGPAIIANNMVAQGVDLPYFCSHGIANKKFIELGGDAVNGVIFPAGKLLICEQLLSSDPQKAVLMQYKADFEAKYGVGTANTFGGHAYDALTMTVMALENIGEAIDDMSLPEARAAIRDQLEEIKGFAGTGGVFNMSTTEHNGLTKGCFVLIKIVDGEWTWLQ